MASGIDSGAKTSEGVVPNSALSFVAPAQATLQPLEEVLEGTSKSNNTLTDTVRQMPIGLQALYDVCSIVYPDQPNPLQVTTKLKYWLGGHEPLDYISMYWNPGDPRDNIPPHWHYISFGLSDLHGDGRVHPPPDSIVQSASTPSGYGLELSMRVAVLDDRLNGPPLWPAAMLQALARYVFTTGNKFVAGDHISWHTKLDPKAPVTSRIRHLLVCEDPQLSTIETRLGYVTFLQVVGCTSKELRAAQRGSGKHVLQKLAQDKSCGGIWHVTVPWRQRSARSVRVCPNGQMAELSGVTARVHWMPWTETSKEEEPASPSTITPVVEQEIKDTLQRGLTTMSTDRTDPEGHMSTDSFEMSSIERALPRYDDTKSSMQGIWQEQGIDYFDGVHLLFNAEAARLLPLAIDSRVSHACHFTWRWGARAVTLTGHGVAGALASSARPYAARDYWLQVYLPSDLLEDMSEQVSTLSRLNESDSESESESEKDSNEPPSIPLTMTWPKHKLKISIVYDHEIL